MVRICLNMCCIFLGECIVKLGRPREKTWSESRNQFLKASRQQIGPHQSNSLSAVWMLWSDTAPQQMTLSDFLCLHATLFTYACGDEVGLKSGLFRSNFSHHSTGEWTLSCSITPTLFKLQSLNSFKDRFCISWDDLDGSLKCFDAAIFFFSFKENSDSIWMKSSCHVWEGENLLTSPEVQDDIWQ